MTSRRYFHSSYYDLEELYVQATMTYEHALKELRAELRHRSSGYANHLKAVVEMQLAAAEASMQGLPGSARRNVSDADLKSLYDEIQRQLGDDQSGPPN